MEGSQSTPGQQCNPFVWFTESQLRSVIRNGVVPEWFHGIISRKTAEELLMPKPTGYFLIRVSESRIGYTLSYRAGDRCRHFMIDALADGQYMVLGENRLHRSLQDLVDFHRRNPIMPFTEVLTVACGQSSDDKTDYAELLFNRRPPNHDTILLPNANAAPQPSTSNPMSPEDVPPALPYRPNNLRHSAVLSPTNRLYPCLEERLMQVTSPLPSVPVPVPMPRNRYLTDNNPPPSQPPEVPARSPGPLLKQNQACVRTVSAPYNPSTHAVPTQPSGTSIQSAKNQEAKPSVVSNLKNLKKKFQKRRSMSQELMYAEIDAEGIVGSGNGDHEYQEISSGQQTFNSPPAGRSNDGGLPQEYRPPPPFAPGYGGM